MRTDTPFRQRSGRRIRRESAAVLVNANGTPDGGEDARRLSSGQLWVNPDCGLKARTWEDVTPALPGVQRMG
ncbi:hypothetical protein [Novosphingobium beihaiensis]|uniref:Cobalamin-independent methionine synthase MetE C-terminal/archaeal domain-containing protein n=1 Tax=Novosphingobium beihaiensis TaxID=2930389 RepID=A0ABT0BQ84_9SPHN|nr:hypothetical protein [Novosphingobium beihaiensis]MCJ2187217.1 hypothetical protein [Novosphingobium beihaiensis]